MFPRSALVLFSELSGVDKKVVRNTSVSQDTLQQSHIDVRVRNSDCLRRSGDRYRRRLLHETVIPAGVRSSVVKRSELSNELVTFAGAQAWHRRRANASIFKQLW